MVADLEKIKLVITEEKMMHVCNHIGETYIDNIHCSEFVFKKGKVYGLVGEHGSGGESISSLLTGRINLDNNIIYLDDSKLGEGVIQNYSWYVGKTECAKGLIRKEISVKKALEIALKQYHCYTSVDDVVADFHLSSGRLNYELSKYSGERLRASLAIGYASNRRIYCFPWMNTMFFHDIILSSGVFRFFEKLKSEGCIIILPTSRKENVVGMVDEIIEMGNPRFDNIISQHPYFIQHFQ